MPGMHTQEKLEDGRRHRSPVGSYDHKRVSGIHRSDNGSEFTAKILRKWLSDIGVITSYIEPGSPWENGYCESFNARMRQEFLNEEQFGSLYEAKVLALRWKDYYNHVRPHGSLKGRVPAPQALVTANA